jgi:NAD(P)-dependent dehydrogenase (short-subunit alcohol dehydrogenase family)
VAGVSIDLSGRTALVTGGTRNIGRAIATTLGRAGATVCVIGSSDQVRLAETLDELRGLGVRAHGELVDVGGWDDLRAALERVEAAVGVADIVVNNVGIRPPVPLAEVTEDRWDRIFAVNVRAGFQCVQWALPHMIEQRWGRIVNVSGMDAVAGSYGRVPVTTSKSAAFGLTASVAPGCARHAVTVNTLVPGTIDTERHTPEWYPGVEQQHRGAAERSLIGRLGSVEEVAGVALFLASDLASYVTGQSLYVGGGFPLARRPEMEEIFGPGL